MDYKKPADLLLVTHQHGDHNKIDKVTLKESGQMIQCPTDIVAGDEIETQGMKITAVSAYNKNHPAEVNVGYILEVDGLTIYHSGDTSMTEQMPELAAFDIDYALVCMDGYYNMGPEEAMEVAEAIQAKHVIPIHSSGSEMYGQENVDAFTYEGKLELKPGESTHLYAFDQ